MRKIFVACWAMLTVLLAMPSCLNSDDDVTTYDDVAVTSVTLGTMNRYLSTTTSAGKDSIYKVTFAGSTIKLVIDHLGCRIFNSDSLPYGTDLKHVVCTLSTKNSALVAIKSTISDSLYILSSKDSIDFSVPRIFRVMATDGIHYREYMMKLTAHQKQPGVLRWTKSDAMPMVNIVEPETIDPEMADDDIEKIPQLSLASVIWTMASNVNCTMWAGRCAETDTTMTLWRKISDSDHAGKWVLMTQSENNPYLLPAMEQVVLLYYQGALLALGSNGTVYKSSDQGITWKTSNKLTMPDGFAGAPMSAFVVDDSIWLTDATGQIWQGEISK